MRKFLHRRFAWLFMVEGEMNVAKCRENLLQLPGKNGHFPIHKAKTNLSILVDSSMLFLQKVPLNEGEYDHLIISLYLLVVHKY